MENFKNKENDDKNSTYVETFLQSNNFSSFLPNHSIYPSTLTNIILFLLILLTQRKELTSLLFLKKIKELTLP